MTTVLSRHDQALCEASELAEGRAQGFLPDEDGNDRLFIVCHQGALHAWRNACPHMAGAPMAWKRDAYLSPDGQHIMCFAHGARFEPDTGLCVHGPCRGQYLKRVNLEIDVQGKIWLASSSSTSTIE
jgi:nitrite reductase/ring-hydroxylating ferredoxin subunit